ncbi:MAG: TIGR04190 family B12-binding domain/radical SAM domain protein [Deltaproteobacteria bacterium]|nr:TIGR04190 family B12-binding domain/radical SAM domain protein [Deltaproteobacteria bacterium]
MSSKLDLVLLHPPSLYDFRKIPVMPGPISDVVPSTPIFEFYPIGFVSLSEYLERHGFRVRIVNVALRMLKRQHFDAEKLITSLNPRLFGLDLHWMAHVQGALALAQVAKHHHPHTPVILGGLSATYFHREILERYPQIDFVARGDSTEEPLRCLLDALKGGGDLAGVPNLSWRDRNGEVRVNPLSYVPDNLDNITIDYRHVMKKVVRYLDPFGYEPFFNWFTYPVTAVFTCRGCVHGCRTCGGSADTYRAVACRKGVAYRSPRLLARDIFDSMDHLNAPVMIIGDIFQAGREYGFELLSALKQRRIKNHIAFEFFRPPSREKLERIAEVVPNFNIEISPESHDEEIRRRFGRKYDNGSLERMIEDALDLGCRRIDLFFMTGLPGQTYGSVLDTVEYCRNLLERFGAGHRLIPFVSPMAPFLDPGSMVFENPEKFGYRLYYRTAEEHRQALMSPSWKYMLNYETEWMTRDEIVYSTYEAALRLNRIKARYGLVGQDKARVIEERIQQAVQLMHEIDRVVERTKPEDREGELRRLAVRFGSLGTATLCGKDELQWPTRFIRMNWFKILRTLLTPTRPNITEQEGTRGG